MYKDKVYELHAPQKSQQQLWRYFSEERLLDLLQTSQLFFTHLPAFTDRLEGMLTKRTGERLLRWYIGQGSKPAIAAKEVAEYEGTRAMFYASCWHMSDHESYLMWKAYADRGYAIRTTFERVQAAFDLFPGLISGGVIDYVDFERVDTAVGNTFTLLSTKDLPYRDEREFRLVFWKPDPNNANHPILPNGTRIPVDLRFLVERVFVSPLLGEPPPHVQEGMRLRGIKWTSSAINVRSEQTPNLVTSSEMAGAS